MILLVTGASGLLGSRVALCAHAAGHRVIGLVGNSSAPVPGAAELRRIDLADSGAVETCLGNVAFDAIVHAAAVSEPHLCEAAPELSQRLNVDLPEQLARIAVRRGVRLVHLSSEQVFDGAHAPYRVGDAVRPLSLYGRQKAESELRVTAAAPRTAVTVRAPLLTGNSASERRSVHERLLAEWMSGKVPRLFVDEFRQTCTAENLAEAVLELSQRDEPCGLTHWAGAELLSRYEQGVRIRAAFGLSEAAAPIVPVRRAGVPEVAARRPANLAMDLAPLDQLLRTRPETFAQQLTRMEEPSWARAWLGARRSA